MIALLPSNSVLRGKMNVQSILREMQCEVKSVARIMSILDLLCRSVLRIYAVIRI